MKLLLCCKKSKTLLPSTGLDLRSSSSSLIIVGCHKVNPAEFIVHLAHPGEIVHKCPQPLPQIVPEDSIANGSHVYIDRSSSNWYTVHFAGYALVSLQNKEPVVRGHWAVVAYLLCPGSWINSCPDSLMHVFKSCPNSVHLFCL